VTIPSPTIPPPTAAPSSDPRSGTCSIVARRVPLSEIPRAAWERLLGVTSSPTPFSTWTFHRAWWDAYGATAHEDYVVCRRQRLFAVDPAAGLPTATELAARTAEAEDEDIVGIVPLMHRHAMEPSDYATHTSLRHAPHAQGSIVPGSAKVVYFGASYHADYATVLADPADLAAVAAATAALLASGPDRSHGSQDWDVLDLRRLRAGDPALDALESTFGARDGWSVAREVEDVCPVLRLDGLDWEGYLHTLSGKDRHEIRRKMRRAEAAGEVRFEFVEDPAGFVDTFVELHQARWGEVGLFPDTEGGRRSRRFLERLAELEGPRGRLRFGKLSIGGDLVFVSAAFHDADTIYFYNAGSRAEVRHLSPGVVGVAWYLRYALDAGYRRFDFLRGDEPYKYGWGAMDEPIERVVVTRTA
jgi:hypothetical protein